MTVKLTTGGGQGSGSTSPTGPAGGVLAGTYPNPDFAVDMATQAELDAAIASVQGSGGPPSGPAGGVLSGTYPNPAFSQDMATQNELNALETIRAASGKGFVNHGATPGATRPSGYASVEWVGSVEPTNAINGDTWVNTA